MQIKSDFPLESRRAQRNVDAEHSAPYSEDASFFSSQLERPSAARPANPQQVPSNLLVDASNALLKSNEAMSNGLRAFSKGNNEKQSLLYGSHLSNSVLLTQMLVKSVSKSAQLIEKISNLQ